MSQSGLLPLPFDPSPPEQNLTQGPPGPGAPEFIFTPGAPQTGQVWGDWADLCAALAALPFGSLPIVTFTVSCTLPSAGMPAGGWPQHGATWRSPTFVTGGATVTVPPAVRLEGLGGLGRGIRVDFASPIGAPQVLLPWSPAAPQVLFVSEGAALTNAGPGPVLAMPGAGVFFVLASNYASWGAVPPLGAPIVEAGAGDVAIAALQGSNFFSPLPAGWVAGPGANLIYQAGATDPIPLTPGWAGPAPIVFTAPVEAAANAYAPATPADWLGAPPTLTGAALDRLAAAVAGLLGGPVP